MAPRSASACLWEEHAFLEDDVRHLLLAMEEDGEIDRFAGHYRRAAPPMLSRRSVSTRRAQPSLRGLIATVSSLPSVSRSIIDAWHRAKSSSLSAIASRSPI